MPEDYKPYQRKALYLALTLPMIVMYVVIAVFLWRVSIGLCVLYCSLFAIVAIAQSYVCVCWQCPYIGKFAPCMGGFCLPSSQIARWFRNTKRTETRYTIAINVAFLAFLGIIGLPIYALYQHSGVYLLVYLGIILGYAVGFLGWICPVCATRHVCPGGQVAMKLRDSLKGTDR